MMSKEELDALILDGSACVQHNNMEQWFEIYDYLVRELNAKP